MTALASILLRTAGVELDTTPEHFGHLLDSSDLLSNIPALQQRITRDGYLYLPGLLHRPDVLAARREVVSRIAAKGLLKPGTDPMDAIINPHAGPSSFQADLAKDNAPLQKILYAGPLMNFFTQFLGGPVRHFDYTWLRAISPGKGTPPHVDSVYMNRGTPRLFTTWAPLGDVDFTLGGLMLLEASNNNTRLKETYGAQDVDSFCSNKPDAQKWGKSWGTGGWLKGNPNTLRKSIAGKNGRWLSTEYKAGDVVIFTIHTVHGSLDNQSPDRIRFSSDSRYQLASEPADERWIGPNPIAHGPAGKREKIC